MTDTKVQQVQTVTGAGKPVPDRLPSVEAARSMFDDFRDAVLEVSARDALVMALHRNTKPYNDDELKALGQGWRANLNLGELKGAVNNRAEAAYNLHMEVPTRILVTVRPEYREIGSPNPLLDYGQIIAEEYTYTLNFDWPENYLLIDQVSRDRIKVGIGVAGWQDTFDWRPKRFPKYNLFTDPMYAPLAHEIPACCIRDQVELSQLLGVLDGTPEAATRAGWNRDVVRAVILGMWRKEYPPTSSEPPAVRDDVVGMYAAFEAWRASRTTEVSRFELQKVPVIRYLIRAVDSKKVSHYLDFDQAYGDAVITDDFMFKKIDLFEDMSQALWLLPYNFGEGTIGSIEGLGHDLAPYVELSNRTVCSGLDGSTMYAGLLLQAEAGFDADEASVLRIGPSTVIPPGLKAVQSSLQPQTDKLFELRSHIRGIFANNVGMTRMSPELMEQARRGTRSTAEVDLERRKEFNIENNSSNFEYLMWGYFHRELFRRLVKAGTKLPSRYPGVKEARAFVRRCVRRGVPKVLFAEHEEALVVEPNRMVGGGSPDARLAIWTRMMEIRGDMDEAGRRHTQREYSAALVGYRDVDAVFPLTNRDKIPTNEISIATLENNQFRQGMYVPAGSDQLHTVHLVQVHFEMLGGMAKTYAENPQSVDLQALITTFAAALPHCQEHVAFLATDKTRAPLVDRFTALIREFVSIYEGAKRDLERSLAAQRRNQVQQQQAVVSQIQQQADFEAQFKYRKAEIDASLERMKQESLNEARAMKTAAQNEIKRMSAEARAVLEREIAERRMQLDEQMAMHKMQLDEMKTRAAGK